MLPSNSDDIGDGIVVATRIFDPAELNLGVLTNAIQGGFVVLLGLGEHFRVDVVSVELGPCWAFFGERGHVGIDSAKKNEDQAKKLLTGIPIHAITCEYERDCMIRFDNKAFNLVLDTVRGSKGMNWKQVAEESGVSASTLSRIIMGKNPDVDSLTRLVHWCGIDFKHLIEGTVK